MSELVLCESRVPAHFYFGKKMRWNLLLRDVMMKKIGVR